MRHSLGQIYRELLPISRKVIYAPKLSKNPYLNLLFKPLIIEGYSFSSFDNRSLFFLFISSLFNKRTFIIHHHWFHAHSLIKLVNLWCRIAIMFGMKLTGSKLVWTIHNKFPHRPQYFLINMHLRRLLAEQSNVILVHGFSEIDSLAKIYRVNKDKFRVVRHPDFIVNIKGKEESIKCLMDNYGLHFSKEKVILIFGQISDYKGVIELIELLGDCNFCSISFLIAGRVSVKIRKRFYELISLNQEIKVINKFIPEDHIASFFGAADFVLFNYQKVLTSGSVILAKNYGKRVIVPKKGDISEYVDNEDILFQNDEELVGVLQRLDR